MAPVTAVYAAVLGLLFVILSVGVIRNRRRARIALGSGDDAHLHRATRAHGNSAEYVPLALVLLLLGELGGTSTWLLHGVGLSLLTGRAAHAYGVSQTEEDYRFRVFGMALTFAAIVASALGCLATALSDLG
jgi:uncharacterized membrane protein YecN with MAPEG domain